MGAIHNSGRPIISASKPLSPLASKNRDIYDDYTRRSAYSLDSQPGMISARSALFDRFDASGKHILDLATGRGFILEEAIKRGASTAIGIDASEHMLQCAAERLFPLAAEKSDLVLIQGDIFHMSDIAEENAPRGIDIVTAANILCFLDQEQRTDVLGQAIKALRPGGIMAVLTRSIDSGMPLSWGDSEIKKYSGCLPKITESIKCYGWSPIDWIDLFKNTGFRAQGYFIGATQTDEEMFGREIDPDCEVTMNENLIFWGVK